MASKYPPTKVGGFKGNQELKNMVKVLNLYAGIGGNRKLWKDVEVIAVELNPKIASIYQSFFPSDKVIVTDAHQYLLEHFEEFDFIWSSPPCPTHSKIRYIGTFAPKEWTRQHRNPMFPDMKLYEEILFLDGYFKGKWCVENVVAWYDPLIKPQEIGRHYYWANFNISAIKTKPSNIRDGSIEELQRIQGFDLSKYQEGGGLDKRLALRNCVEGEIGKEILECAIKVKQVQLNSLPTLKGRVSLSPKPVNIPLLK